MAAFVMAPFKIWLRGAVAAAFVAALAPVSIAAPQDPRADGGGSHFRVKARHLHKDKTATKKPAGDAAPDKTGKGEADAKNPPAPEAPPPPYEPQMLRLAEILGALAYLDDICGSNDDWRAKMQDLLEAEAKTENRKERLAGTFNRGFHDYQQTYQACTPNAQIIISRFLAEGGALAREIVSKFSAS